MRVMVLVKASEESEAGQLPSADELNEMGRFNSELVAAGIMLAAEGISQSSRGKRVRYSGKDSSVVDGPFAETKELVSGFWIWQVASMDEALEWARRIPFSEGEVELRPVFEAADFGDEFTPEMQEREAALREQMESQQQ